MSQWTYIRQAFCQVNVEGFGTKVFQYEWE